MAISDHERAHIEFWANPQEWPPDYPEQTFLARAVYTVGKSMFGDGWIGTEPATALVNPSFDRAQLEMDLGQSLSDASFAQLQEMATWGAEESLKRRERANAAFARLSRLIMEGAIPSAIQEHPRGGLFVTLPAGRWNSVQSLHWFTCCKMDPLRPFEPEADGPNHRWLYVDFRSLQVAVGRSPYYLDESEDDQSENGTAQQPIEPMRSGAPGRPSSMATVLAEFQRRLLSGEAAPTNSAEAEILEKWFIANYPDSHAPTRKTIRNRISPERRRLSARN